MTNVNGVGGKDSTPKIPNTSNFESQQCTASQLPPALNSVWSKVKNPERCEIEMDGPSADQEMFTTTTTCDGLQIVDENYEMSGALFETRIKENTGKLENRSGEAFNEYSVDKNGLIECKNQDDEPCQ